MQEFRDTPDFGVRNGSDGDGDARRTRRKRYARSLSRGLRDVPSVASRRLWARNSAHGAGGPKRRPGELPTRLRIQ